MKDCNGCFGAGQCDCQRCDRIYNGQRMTEKEMNDKEQEAYLKEWMEKKREKLHETKYKQNQRR